MSPATPFAIWLLEQEARALLTRLARIKPFALQETMLPAANLLPQSQMAIEAFLTAGRIHLRTLVNEFLDWLRRPEGRQGAEESQRMFAMLRLRFNAVLTQFDLFNDVITQRSEHETGVFLSGLDVVSADALRLRGRYFEAPPVICYLDRGVGAAIRRARTRFPGGGSSPVAIIRVPRERMVGSGIASSLVHEVGHQAAALLGLVDSLRPALRQMAASDTPHAPAWELWERWISEIVADFWSVARVGIGSTAGLMGVVSLPRAFVFRMSANDPHPAPWIRVKLSAAMGNALYPQPHWERLSQAWESFYPPDAAGRDPAGILSMLQRTMPRLVSLVLDHRPPALGGVSLREGVDTAEIRPGRLRRLLARWRTAPEEMYRTRPIVAFAAVGQGRADDRISPEEESVVLGKLLTHWALRSTLQAAAGCAQGALRSAAGAPS